MPVDFTAITNGPVALVSRVVIASQRRSSSRAVEMLTVFGSFAACRWTMLLLFLPRWAQSSSACIARVVQGKRANEERVRSRPGDSCGHPACLVAAARSRGGYSLDGPVGTEWMRSIGRSSTGISADGRASPSRHPAWYQSGCNANQDGGGAVKITGIDGTGNRAEVDIVRKDTGFAMRAEEQAGLT